MELLPCPFCGGKATFDHDDNGWYWIVCEKCGTATNSRTHTMEDCHPLLAEQWNRRVIPLHEMLDDCRKQFDDWWAEFTSAHEDWRFADSDALRWQAWQAAWNYKASPASAPELTTLLGAWERRSQDALPADAMLINKQSAALKLAREALGEMQDLIDESYGVYGLHLNGDESPWSELEQGGRFERLITLSEALAAIDEVLKGE